MSEYWGELAPKTPFTPSNTRPVGVDTPLMTGIPVEFSSQSDRMDFQLTDHRVSDPQRQLMHTCLVSDLPIGCPLMIQTIKLMRLLRQLNDTTVKSDVTIDSIPQLIPSEDNHSNGLNVLKIKEKIFNEKAVKELMKRAVIIISVFYGFDFMDESVLDLLVDVLSHYLLRLCQSIRATSDSLSLKSCNDFIDVMNRVFHDMNVSDFECLRQYKCDLVVYNQNLMKEVIRRIESTNSTRKMRCDLPALVDTNSDTSPQLSVNSQSSGREEPTLSLKSLLSSYKSDDIHENEQLFGLTSPLNSASNKSI